MPTLFDITSADIVQWLSQLSTLAGKSALILVATGIMAYTLRNSAAAVRYLVWCSGLLSLMFLPLFSSALPTWEVAILPGSSLPAATIDAPQPPSVTVAPPAPVEPKAWGKPEVPLEEPSAPIASTAPEPAPVLAEPEVPAEEPIAMAPPTPVDQSVRASAFWGAPSSFHWTTWLFIAWVVGMFSVLARLAIAHIGAHMLIKNSELVHEDDWHLMAESIQKRLGITQVVRLRYSSWTTVPMSVGIWRPLVVLPMSAKEWDDQQRQTVLVHELAHVKRRDCLLHLLTQVTCALYWFNPLAWVASWRLRVERERACDDIVIRYGIDPSLYAETLLQTARNLRRSEWSTVAAVSMARRSQLEGRLLSILDPMRHRQLNTASVSLTLALVACFVVPLAVLKPVHAQKAPQEIAASAPVATDFDVHVPDIDIPEMNIHIPDIEIPEINIPEMDITIPEIVIPEFEVTVPEMDFDFNFEGVDQSLAYTSIDSLTIEQMIQLRKYGVDADFIRALRSIGFDDLTYGELVQLGKYGADADFIEEMNRSGYTGFDLRDYAIMSKYGVDEDFVAAMSAAGYRDLSADDLVNMSKYGVDEDLIESLGRNGYENMSVSGLINASKYGVDEDLIDALNNNGYDNLSVSDLVNASKYGVDEDLIDALGQYGYDDVSIDELINASKYGLDEDLVSALSQAGYTNLDVDELVAMNKYGVDEDLILTLSDNGYTNLAPEDLINASKFGVDEDLIVSLSKAGYNDLNLSDLISMSKYGVDEDLIDTLARYNYRTLSPSELINASKYGVDEDLIIALEENNIQNVDFDEIISMSKYGVDEDLIGAMKDAGFDVNAHDLIRLQKYGVDEDYVRDMREAGLKNLTIDKLVEMRKHGLDADYIKEMRGNN